MKWLLMFLLVVGIALASSPALAQGDQPSQLRQHYYQELAKYNDMVNQYDILAAAYQETQPGPGPNFAGARRMLSQITAQGRKVQALQKALEQAEGGARR